MPRTLISKVLVPGGLTVALCAFGSLAQAAGKPSGAFSSPAALQSQRVGETKASSAALQPLLPDTLALLTRTASLHVAGRGTGLIGGCSCPTCRRLSVGLASKLSPFGTAPLVSSNSPMSLSETSSY